MKKKYLALEFAVVFLLIALPPLFSVTSAGIPQKVSLGTMYQLLVAVILSFSMKSSVVLPPEEKKKRFMILLVKSACWWALAFGILMLVFAFFQGLIIVLGIHLDQETVIPPKYIAGWLSVAAVFLVGAWFEEVLYRNFLPETMVCLLPSRKLVSVAAEAVCILVFAFAHRYHGWFSVLNAAVSGIVLRVCFRKTGSVLAGTSAHFLYNMVMYFFSAMNF